MVHPRRVLAELAVCLLCAGTLTCAGRAASPAPDMAALPASGRITIADYGYRAWAPALLHYGVAARKLKDGPLCLLDEVGTPVPAQVDGGVLSFVASLDKGGSVSFSLAAGQPATSSLTLTKRDDLLEIGNESYRLLLPAVGQRTFARPAEAATVPAPLQGWQPVGGPWMGASRFVTERKIASCSARLLRNGPACIVYEARYRFAPEGEYVWRVSVSPGIAYADITEEYDFNAITAGQDFLLLELQKGWTPASIGWLAGEGTGGITREALNAYLDKRLKAANAGAAVGGAGVTPLPPCPEAGMALLDNILPAGKWGGYKGGVELRGAADAANAGLPAARVAAVPMHSGSWRRALALTVWQGPAAGITMALPISTRRCTWYAEVTDDISPFSTHEHDIGLRPSYGRREWALDFGAESEALQQTAGYIGLDDYKNWTLDWPETTKASDYPRAWFTKADVEAIKASLDRHPDKEMLSRFYVVSGKTEDAVKSAESFISGTISQHEYAGNWYVPGLSHYRQSQFFEPVALLADDALACPDLPAEVRQRLRRTVAFNAYMMAQPDLNPRGAGVHLGNNNMSINRTCALAYFAGLLPDHPLYRYWMDQITRFVAYKYSTQVAWDGATIECPSYWLYGPGRFLQGAITVLHNTGGPDFAPQQARTMLYYANLTVPDARFNGRRIIAGMGNSANMLDGIFGATLATVTRADPKQAELMQRLYRLAWPTQPLATQLSNGPWSAWEYRPDVPESQSGLSTCIIPTYGVVFRNQFGTPDETALLFRAGINWSHWDTDAGNVILYGKGAPLSPGTGYQYYYGPAMENEAIYHNQVKVGAPDQQEVFGRVDDALTDYGFNPSADYAANSRFYPSQLFKDGRGAMSWNRHVLFLKSDRPGGADYFVMRDTFPGGEGRRTWWTWLNLETPDRISVDGAAFAKDQPEYNKRVPEAQMPTRTGRTVEMRTDFGAATQFWFANREPLEVRVRLVFEAGNGGLLGLNPQEFPKQRSVEVKTVVEALAKPGEDYLYVVFPKRDGEAGPACARIHEHGLKITTPEATDYVFVADEPLQAEVEGVVFAGKAGAVRVFPDRVAFSLNAGTGRIGYQGTIFEGTAPFERVVKRADLKPGVVKVEGGYEKKRQELDLGEAVTITGEGPFAAKLEGRAIRISAEGRARVLYVTRPEWIWRPQYWIDGAESMACWTDYPSSGWGSYDRTALMAISVPGGKHELVLKNCVFPPCWKRSFVPTIAGAETAATQ